jgi:hypothetical protein
MIYVLGIKDTKVLAYDGKHFNVLIRLFGNARQKISEGIVSIYLRVSRETDELEMRGYSEYYVVSVKDTHLVRAVAKTCLGSRDRTTDVNSVIDRYAKDIEQHVMVIAYTVDYREIEEILEQIRMKSDGEALFHRMEEIPI